MKKLLIVCMAVGAVALLLPGQAAAQTIETSKHDLSGGGYGTTEVCIFCHTPHDAPGAAADGPLWNHEITATDAAAYEPYDSPTMDATDVGDPANGISKLCLSCHDGTVAIDSFGGNVGTVLMGTINGGASVRAPGDGDINHPVSMTYEDVLDGELFAPVSGIVGGELPLFGVGADQVECASCHDVHDSTYVPFLRLDNDGSALCLTCHNK